MAPSENRFARLVGIADLKRDRSVQALARLRRRIRWLQREIDHVRTASRHVTPDAYALAGRDPVTALWQAKTLARLNGELARHLAQEETLKRQTARASARAQVVQELARRAGDRS